MKIFFFLECDTIWTCTTVRKFRRKSQLPFSGYRSLVTSYLSIFCLLYRECEVTFITLNEILQNR